MNRFKTYYPCDLKLCHMHFFIIIFPLINAKNDFFKKVECHLKEN